MYAPSFSNSLALSAWPKALAAETMPQRISERNARPEERLNAIWKIIVSLEIRGKKAGCCKQALNEAALRQKIHKLLRQAICTPRVTLMVWRWAILIRMGSSTRS